MPKSSSKASQFVPHTPEIEGEMLRAMGFTSFDDLLSAIPEELRLTSDLPLPTRRSEVDVKRGMEMLARQNSTVRETLSFLGGGSYDHYVPDVVPYLASRAEFATSYTPYQAEVSQGTLQAIYEYQTMICQITGMEVGNASLYDGASAVAEACLLTARVAPGSVVLVSDGLYAHYLRVTETYLQYSTLSLESIPSRDGLVDLDRLKTRMADDVSAVVVQSPNRLGLLESWKKLGQICAGYPALFVAVGDPLSF
ncbi:MAG: glycine dehydrogenase, partial [Fidelibacterota bacterium]